MMSFPAGKNLWFSLRAEEEEEEEDFKSQESLSNRGMSDTVITFMVVVLFHYHPSPVTVLSHLMLFVLSGS